MLKKPAAWFDVVCSTVVHIHRQKLEEMVARFEAESPEIGTGETFLHKVQITTGTDRIVFIVATWNVLASCFMFCRLRCRPVRLEMQQRLQL